MSTERLEEWEGLHLYPMEPLPTKNKYSMPHPLMISIYVHVLTHRHRVHRSPHKWATCTSVSCSSREPPDLSSAELNGKRTVIELQYRN